MLSTRTTLPVPPIKSSPRVRSSWKRTSSPIFSDAGPASRKPPPLRSIVKLSTGIGSRRLVTTAGREVLTRTYSRSCSTSIERGWSIRSTSGSEGLSCVGGAAQAHAPLGADELEHDDPPARAG